MSDTSLQFSCSLPYVCKGVRPIYNKLQFDSKYLVGLGRISIQNEDLIHCVKHILFFFLSRKYDVEMK